jgi:nicotinamide mononucleotide adenylyltransferase
MEIIVEKFDKLKPIDFNFEQIKCELANMLEKYKGLVVTDDAITEAKKTRAELNKLKDAINDKKKEVKAVFSAPYTEFEEKIKELMAMIELPTREIDNQVKAFEDAKKQERIEELERVFKENNFDDRFQFMQIFNQQWLNQSVSLKKAVEELTSIITKAKSDYQLVLDLHSEFEIELENIFFQNLDISKVMSSKIRMDAAKVAKEEAKAQQKAMEAKNGAVAEVKVRDTIISPKLEVNTVAEEPKSVEINMLEFRVFATDCEIEMIKNFLDISNISYERIK